MQLAKRIEKRDKDKEVKLWAVYAADGGSRGKCYTIIQGTSIETGFPVCLTYEKNEDGTESEVLKKAIII